VAYEQFAMFSILNKDEGSMAYQTRRDPLFDHGMQAVIEKRGRELIGVVLLIVGAMTAAMMLSYTPDDPNWMTSTDAPIQNWTGQTGAAIAGTLFMIAGWGFFGIPIILLAWGARFILNLGIGRALGRLIFAPIAIALGAIYASTLQPGPEWISAHAFGLGGLFGDTVASVILTLLPLGSAFSIKLVSFLMGVGILIFGAFVTGFTRPEVQSVSRFLFMGIVMAYAGFMTLLGLGASGAIQSARAMQERKAERRFDRETEELELEGCATDSQDHDEYEEEVEKPSLLARMPTLIKRAVPGLEDVLEPPFTENYNEFSTNEEFGEQRIKAKISDVIKSRVRSNPALHVTSVAPLSKGRGRGPDPLVLNTHPQNNLPSEPPLTSPILSHAEAFETAPHTGSIDAPVENWIEDDSMFDNEEVSLPELNDGVTSDAQPITSKIIITEPRKVVQQPLRKPVQPSARAKAEAQPALRFEDTHPGFELPPLNLLETPIEIQRQHLSDDALEENARMLENVLDDYGVKGEIVAVRPGPVVTMYELEPAPGLKASRVIGLADDIARSMAALSARVSTVPGRSVIGIELPNENREKVVLREILASRDFGDSRMRLPLALGKDIGGEAVVANLAKMPHLLIAGTTGSGKSVAINTMILSLLYKLSPEECRLIMIDPKMLELSVYDGIPHLLSPVVTDPKKAVVALKWTVGEMEERYRKMSKMGVRNIEGYNGRVREALAKDEMFSRTVQTGFDDDTGEPIFETEEIMPEALPYIVVIVDEMADLMMVAGKEIEACIQRLAQMARASGIHLIMATQRPSVDVITGTIKANFPTRISFQVTSKIDSRTILGEMGAEQLLGMGDMLYMAGGAKITRCHGPFVSDEEVEEVVNHLKGFGAPAYVSDVVKGPSEDKESSIDQVLGLGGNTDGEDALYDTAVAIVIKDRKCSTSYIQRKLAIGYNKAARLVEQMEDQGLVSPANHVGKREILVPENG
jgi:S-DNA-T family DNA segregation ATPase FtsK/SpoIIIE